MIRPATPHQVAMSQHIFDVFNRIVVLKVDEEEHELYHAIDDADERERVLYEAALEVLRLYITEEHDFKGTRTDAVEDAAK